MASTTTPQLLRSLGSVILILAWTRSAAAGDVSGTARVIGTTTDSASTESDTTRQEYNLQYTERISPWLDFLLSWQSSEFDQETNGVSFERTSREPLMQLVYRRAAFSGRIGYRDGANRGTNAGDNLDTESAFAQFFWKGTRGPSYSLRWTDSSNVADVQVFGRDIDSSLLEFDVNHFAKRWQGRYSLQSLDLDNNTTGFSLDQIRHYLQGAFEDRYLADQLHFSTDWRVTRTEQDEEAPTGTTLGQPLAAFAGLGGIDLTPAIGTLPAVPNLNDGDTVTAAGPPPIDIGGANTFRNVGVDLGFTQPVSRLEVTLTALSDPALVWVVYESSDNLNWTAIGGVASTFDAAFQRYTLVFPETTNRYFKAVNVSVNSQVNVFVTEVRALLDVASIGQQEMHSTSVQGTALTRWDPTARFGTDLTVSIRDDSGSGGFIQQDTRDVTYDALIRYEATDTIGLRGRYQLSEFDRNQGQALTRDETRYSASMLWDPLPTVDALFSLTRREETENNTLLRRSDTLQARGITELLSGLRVSSEFTLSSVEDPFAGFEIDSWGIRETVDAQPITGLSLHGGFSYQQLDSTGSVSISRRMRTDLNAIWNLSRIGLGGYWDYAEEDDTGTFYQRYRVTWTPGSRFNTSLSYASNDSTGLVKTDTWSANLGYRLNRNLNFFADASRSQQRLGTQSTERVDSVQFGLMLAF